MSDQPKPCDHVFYFGSSIEGKCLKCGEIQSASQIMNPKPSLPTGNFVYAKNMPQGPYIASYSTSEMETLKVENAGLKELLENLQQTNVAMSRASGALCDARTVRTDNVELGIIELTKQRDGLKAQNATLREALELTHKAFHHWDGGASTSNHWFQLVDAKEAVSKALSSTPETSVSRSASELKDLLDKFDHLIGCYYNSQGCGSDNPCHKDCWDVYHKSVEEAEQALKNYQDAKGDK